MHTGLSTHINVKIFVSYTTRDPIVTMSSLFPIVETLSLIGNPYVDLIHNDSANKQQRVEQELINSSMVLLLETESIATSPWVQWELNKAKCLGIPIKSIRIAEGMPSKKQLLNAVC